MKTSSSRKTSSTATVQFSAAARSAGLHLRGISQAAGLCCRVEYDPAIHGEGIEADPGDEIWWWGDFDWMNDQVHSQKGRERGPDNTQD